MPLFKSKPKLSIEECCRQFYDSNIFHSKLVASIDFWPVYLDTVFKQIAEADQSFLSIDPTLFRDEMTALRMELFAFALGRSKKFGKEKYTVPQSLFTKSYLEEGNIEVWDIMGEYNQAIAMSATMDATGKTTLGGIGRAQVTSVNLTRFNAAKEWMKANIVNNDAITQQEEDKLKCVTRVINRIGADVHREDNVVVKLLASRCANRLGCNENLDSEALHWLGTAIFGFYKGAEDYLKSIDLQG